MPQDKTTFVISIVVASLLVLMLVIAGVMLFRIYLKRKNKLLLEKKLMSAQFEQTLLQSKLEIQEQIFRDISQELHDNIGQVLSLVRLNLNTLNAQTETEKITLMDELLEKSLTDLRNLSHSLDADYIRSNGWEKPAAKLLSDLQNSGKYSTYIDLEDDLPTLGNEKPIILFRMIQEIVNNIVRHASADKISLRARIENKDLVIAIKDNGKGFDRRAVSAGSGLRNLENRAKMINAGLTINSDPGKGTTVNISINPEDAE